MRVCGNATGAALVAASLLSSLGCGGASGVQLLSDSQDVSFVPLPKEAASALSSVASLLSMEEAPGLDGEEASFAHSTMESVDPREEFERLAAEGRKASSLLDFPLTSQFLQEVQSKQSFPDFDGMMRALATLQRSFDGGAVLEEGNKELSEQPPSAKKAGPCMGRRRSSLRGVKTSVVGLSLSFFFLAMHLLLGQQSLIRRRRKGDNHVVTELGRSEEGVGSQTLGVWLLALAASSSIAASGLFELATSLHQRSKATGSAVQTPPLHALQLVPSSGRKQMAMGAALLLISLLIVGASASTKVPSEVRQGAKLTAAAGVGLLALGLAVFLHAIKQRVDLLKSLLPREGGGLVEELVQFAQKKPASGDSPTEKRDSSLDGEVNFRSLNLLLEQLGLGEAL